MILTCPACGTSYVVKDGAIPPQGRQVRCASCKHSWHQDPENSAEAEAADALATGQNPDAPGQQEPEPEPPSTRPPVLSETPPQNSSSESNPQAAAELASTEPVTADEDMASPEIVAEPAIATAPAAAEAFPDWDDRDAYAEQQAPRRRGPLIILGLIVLVAALAAAAWFLAPREWLAKAGLREAGGSTPLKLAVSPPGRQKLASGNDLVSLSGRIINPTEQTLAVPPLQADLRDGGGKLVYSWTIAPPAARLPPRGSASFNSAELGVPPNAQYLTLRWTD